MRYLPVNRGLHGGLHTILQHPQQSKRVGVRGLRAAHGPDITREVGIILPEPAKCLHAIAVRERVHPPPQNRIDIGPILRIERGLHLMSGIDCGLVRQSEIAIRINRIPQPAFEDFGALVVLIEEPPDRVAVITASKDMQKNFHHRQSTPAISRRLPL